MQMHWKPRLRDTAPKTEAWRGACWKHGDRRSLTDTFNQSLPLTAARCQQQLRPHWPGVRGGFRASRRSRSYPPTRSLCPVRPHLCRCARSRSGLPFRAIDGRYGAPRQGRADRPPAEVPRASPSGTSGTFPRVLARAGSVPVVHASLARSFEALHRCLRACCSC